MMFRHLVDAVLTLVTALLPPYRRQPAIAEAPNRTSGRGLRQAMPPTNVPATNRIPSRQPARSRVPRAPAPTGGRRLTLGKRGQGLGNFVRELRSEVRKVVWPTRQQAMNLTAVVIGLSAAVGAFLGAIDFVFQEFFRFLLQVTGAGGY
jgi:preprotein translocase subunit SecE